MEKIIIDALNRFYAYTFTDEFINRFLVVIAIICGIALWKQIWGERIDFDED